MKTDSYEGQDYIEDIYQLGRMEFSLDSIDKAASICDKLKGPMCYWRFRKIDAAFTVGLVIFAVCFGYTLGRIA